MLEGLDYACLNDFSYIGKAVSAFAAGGLVTLVGRNEAGKTLSRSSVDAVLGSFACYFDPTHWQYTRPASRILNDARRVATVAIADANKKIRLLYTSYAADELICVDLGGRRIIKKKTTNKQAYSPKHTS